MGVPALSAMVDATPLDAETARELWQRFSAYMETHRNDFAGFARSEGFAHAEVAVRGGTPTLTLLSKRPKKPGRRSGKKRRKKRR